MKNRRKTKHTEISAKYILSTLLNVLENLKNKEVERIKTKIILWGVHDSFSQKELSFVRTHTQQLKEKLDLNRKVIERKICIMGKYMTIKELVSYLGNKKEELKASNFKYKKKIEEDIEAINDFYSKIHSFIRIYNKIQQNFILHTLPERENAFSSYLFLVSETLSLKINILKKELFLSIYNKEKACELKKKKKEIEEKLEEYKRENKNKKDLLNRFKSLGNEFAGVVENYNKIETQIIFLKKPKDLF